MNQSRFQLTIPPGVLVVTLSGESITDIDLRVKPRGRLAGPASTSEKRIAAELARYFADPRAPLCWALQIEGSDYQQRIWRALRAIPVGSVKTYGQLADEVGGCAQAVGNACRQNPVPIYIPCHRVVAKGGIGGFGGKTSGQRIDLKRWLLHHEGVMLSA